MDYSFDPCQALASLDLENPHDLKKILQRDKHTRIEGICTEALFSRDLLAESFPNFSTGWWFLFKAKRFRVIKIASEIETLSRLDFDLLTFFFVKAIPTFIICFDEKVKNFFYVKFDCSLLNDFYKKWQQQKKIVAPRPQSAPLPSSSDRQATRLHQAINLLESLDLLKRAAIERLFANCWLASGAYWDIDAFTQYQGKFFAFEVKQKYPTAAGTFGLNRGLCKLFSFLSDLGVKVIHVILTKPVSDRTVSAIDFYTQVHYQGLSLWIATNFDRKILSASFSSAPARTSIYGAQKLTYYHIRPEHFHKLKILGSGASTVLRDFIEGKTSPLSGTEELPVFSGR